MKLPTKYPNELRELLQKEGLYSERNEPLIEKANRLNTLILRAEKELGKHTLLLRTIGSAKQEKIVMHPLLPELRKLHTSHARVLSFLGLGNKTISESESDSDLKELMEI